MKPKSMVAFFLVFAISFTAVPIFPIAFFIVPDIRRYAVASGGETTDAVPYDKVATMVINDEQRYKILFLYGEKDGKQNEGETSSAYTRAEADAIIASGTLRIRYTKNGAIQDDYKFGIDMLPLVLVMGLFMLVGIGFWIAIGFTIKRGLKEKRTLKLGRRTAGKFVDMYSRTSVNDVPYYNIVYKFQNDKFEQVSMTSGAVYTFEHAQKLKSLGSFEVTYLDDFAVISQDLSGSNKQGTDLDPHGGTEVFMRYAERDPLFELVRRELAKEPDTAARKKLLREHSETLKADTLQNLQSYIDFLDVNGDNTGRRQK